MYYTGYDPRTMQPVYVPINPHEKAMQRALIQYRDPKNYELVKEALLREGRDDLIGFGPECLITPRPMKIMGEKKGKNRQRQQRDPEKQNLKKDIQKRKNPKEKQKVGNGKKRKNDRA